MLRLLSLYCTHCLSAPPRRSFLKRGVESDVTEHIFRLLSLYCTHCLSAPAVETQQTRKSRTPMLRIRSSQRFSLFQTGIGYNVAMHASFTAFLISASLSPALGVPQTNSPGSGFWLESRSIEDFLFPAWNRKKYSYLCLTYCHGFSFFFLISAFSAPQ